MDVWNLHRCVALKSMKRKNGRNRQVDSCRVWSDEARGLEKCSSSPTLQSQDTKLHLLDYLCIVFYFYSQ